MRELCSQQTVNVLFTFCTFAQCKNLKSVLKYCICNRILHGELNSYCNSFLSLRLSSSSTSSWTGASPPRVSLARELRSAICTVAANKML